MKKATLCCLVILLVACTGGGAPSATPSTADMDAEEEAVYAALLADMYPAPLYVIMETSQTDIGDASLDESLAYVLENMTGVEAETVAGFRLRNETPSPLRADMQLGAPYVLFSLTDMRELFSENQNGWEVFYNRYPDAPGIITLSRVGFNATLDQALVYIGDQAHWLAGAGYYVLLKKVDGAWVVDQQVMTWIS